MATFSHLCMNCWSPLPEDAADYARCPVCGDPTGEPNPPRFLQTGAMLSARYMVGRLKSAAGDAAVYAGYDTVLKSPITIREFWPETLCRRGDDDALIPREGGEQTVEEYRNAFLAHARVVARMRDLPASIPTYDIFQQNNTAYTVSERCEGETLAAFLERRGGHIPWDEARPLFIPLMTSLIALHKAGVLHLGLCPENLILANDGKLHIDGFAIPQARTSDSELIPALETGYAAPEQYAVGASCGEHTDVYGLAAVIFRTLVGSPPPDAETRPKANTDLTVPANVASELPPHVAAALFDALQPNAERRTAAIAALRDRLAEAPAVAALLDDETTGEPDDENTDEQEPSDEAWEEEEEEPKSHRTLFAVLLVAGIVLALAVLALILLLNLFPNSFGREGGDEPTALTSGNIVISDTTASHAANMMASVPNLIGQSYSDLRGKYVEDRPVLLGGLQYSDTVPAGIVLSQTPGSDKQADITDPVYVIISAGSEYVTVPDVTGWPLEHAMAYMTALGFEVQVDDVGVSTQEPGCIDSTSPARGNSLARGSIIRLRVSTATTAEPETTASSTTTRAPSTTPTSSHTASSATSSRTASSRTTETTAPTAPSAEPDETTAAEPDETDAAEPENPDVTQPET